MINPDILTMLESTEINPSYSVVISKFKQINECNRDKVKVTVQQFNPNLEVVIEQQDKVIDILEQVIKDNNIENVPEYERLYINSCIEKTLNIESGLDFNKTDSLFISKLNGSMDNDTSKDLTRRFVKGEIKNGIIKIITKDNPNYFNKTKFKIRNNKFIVNVPKKINEIDLTIFENDNIVNTYSEINEDNNIIVNEELDNKEYTFQINYTIKNDITFHKIESITTPLMKEIELEFNNTYSKLPAVVLSMDEDSKHYTSYQLKYSKDEDNKYNGVTISFKGIKRNKNYNNINITIIGE